MELWLFETLHPGSKIHLEIAVFGSQLFPGFLLKTVVMP